MKKPLIAVMALAMLTASVNAGVLAEISPEAENSFIWIGGGILAFTAFLLIANMMAKANKKVRAERSEQLKQETIAFINNGNANGFPKIETPVLLKPDEGGLLCEPSSLYEARRTRRVYGGASFRVARGFYVHGGQSQSVQDFERIDSGSLTLTNKRLVFDGSMESRVVDLNKIVSAEVAASDSIQITTNGRMKDSTFTVHNPILWSVLIQSMVKDPNCVYAMNKPDATPPSSNGAPTREQMQSWWIAKNGTDHCVLN